MTNELELILLKEIEELKQEIRNIKGETQALKPVYQCSKIRDSDLESLVDIEKNLDKSIFKSWFESSITIDDSVEALFIELIKDNELLMDSYSEEDLKVNFLNKVH
jgi:hypothetical protein